jgi:hypothetical protein
LATIVVDTVYRGIFMKDHLAPADWGYRARVEDALQQIHAIEGKLRHPEGSAPT